MLFLIIRFYCAISCRHDISLPIFLKESVSSHNKKWKGDVFCLSSSGVCAAVVVRYAER